VAQLLEGLRYKPEGSQFDSWRCHKPFACTMALESTQCLTEKSTRYTSWGWRWPVRRANNLTTFMCRFSRNSGSLDLLEPSKPVQGLLACFSLWVVNKVKLAVEPAMKAQTGSTSIAILFPSPRFQMGWVVNATTQAALPSRMTRYPLYRRLGGPQGRSGRVREISSPPWSDPRTVQPRPTLSSTLNWKPSANECLIC
jgi:hypothetical protein